METKQRTFKRILSPSVQPIGQALCRGNWQSIALAVTKCDEVWSLVINHVSTFSSIPQYQAVVE